MGSRLNFVRMKHIWAVAALGFLLLYQNCGSFQAAQFGEMTKSSNDPHNHDDHNHPPAKLVIPLPSKILPDSVTVGDLLTTAAGKTQNLKLSGRALMIRGDGKTRVEVYAMGLAPDSMYSVHVHVAACSTGAGGHYKINEAQTTVTRENEIWPDVTTDANGWGYGIAQANHVARQDAVSVVIHGKDGAKVACADLKPATVLPAEVGPKGGAFSVLQVGASPVTGFATMAVKSNGQTEIRLAVKGLMPSAMYMSHLHNAACEMNAGGGHYKIDTTIAGTVEANEIWPVLATNAAGYGFGYVLSDHTVRAAEAASVVIHGPDGAKLACANLAAANGLVAMEKGLERSATLAGTASMERRLDGKTAFTLNVSGFLPSKAYVAHVHNRPCQAGGGAHYKIDETVTTVVEANEVFLRFTTNPEGFATTTTVTDHTARPDAVSIVIHDPVDAAKLACVDLN